MHRSTINHTGRPHNRIQIKQQQRAREKTIQRKALKSCVCIKSECLTSTGFGAFYIASHKALHRYLSTVCIYLWIDFEAHTNLIHALRVCVRCCVCAVLCVWAICTSHTHTHKRYCLMCHPASLHASPSPDQQQHQQLAHFSIQSVVLLCAGVRASGAFTTWCARASLCPCPSITGVTQFGAALCFREMSLHAHSRKYYYKPLSIVCVSSTGHFAARTPSGVKASAIFYN